MFHTSEFRGQIRTPARIMDSSGEELFQKLKLGLTAELERRGVPANVKEDFVKSGGFFGSKSPMLLVIHPNPPSSFFAMGFIVNENLISFQYFGESAQNTKKNTRDALEAEGKYIRAKLFKPDEFLLQQEEMWNIDVMAAFDAMWEKVN